MKILFSCVNSTLQLLNLVEYISREADEIIVHLLVIKGRPQGNFTYDFAVEYFSESFESISSVTRNRPFSLMNPFRSILEEFQYKKRLIELLKTYSCSFDKVVLGHSSSYDFALISGFFSQSTIIVDDGIKTLDFLSHPEEREIEISFWRGSSASKLVLWSIYGSCKSYLEYSSYFSAYSDLAKSVSFPVIRNDYSYLRSLFSSGSVGLEVHFLGQPLVELGFMTRADYLDYITRVVEASSVKFIYFPHPAENLEVVKAFAVEKNWEVRVINSCYEWYFLSADERPCQVFSFFSSSLTVLPKFRFSGVDFFALDCLMYLNDSRIKESALEFYRLIETFQAVRVKSI